MNTRAGLLTALAAIALVGWTAVPAAARPPTVGINPGYDRRLTESRQQTSGPERGPGVTAPVVHNKHARRHRY